MVQKVIPNKIDFVLTMIRLLIYLEMLRIKKE